jgi:putative transposase
VKVHPFIEAEKAADHSVQRACVLLEVSRAAYYQRRTGVLSPRAVADAAIAEKITVIHEESGGTYGSPRIHQALRKDEGGGLREAAGCPADAHGGPGRPPRKALAHHDYR